MHIHARREVEQSEGEQSFVGPITASLYSFVERSVSVAIIGVVDLVFPKRYRIF